MKTLWHYSYHYHSGLFSGRWELALPAGAQPLGIHYENGMLGIWVLLDPAEPASQLWAVWGRHMGEEFNVPEGSTLHYLGIAKPDGPNALHYFAFRQKGKP